MKTNIFRVARWITGAVVLIWLVGCIRDFIYFEAWNWDGMLLAGMLAFSAAGAAIIVGVAWAIGRIVRRALSIPKGRDFRPDDEAKVF